MGRLTQPNRLSDRAGPDLQLIAALGLRTDTQRIPQHHLGCHGGFRLLTLAAQIARGNPMVSATIGLARFASERTRGLVHKPSC